MSAYYNEIDPFVAQWLRNLIAVGHIAPGEVDERSIEDVHPSDIQGFAQCHFFAGIGVWSHGLRLAHWPDDRPVWTGSCPCQPFSTAGKGGGFADERHLWPAWHHLISECRPAVVFGEQVASGAAGEWLDLVQDDLDGVGYAFGAVPFPAAGVGAPHIRDRLYWVADAQHGRREARQQDWVGPPSAVMPSGPLGRLDNTISIGRGAGRNDDARYDRQQSDAAGSTDRPRQTNGHWADADWLCCRDGKWRPVEPGTFPLAHGAAGRVGRLRAYGNAIVAPQAATFIRAYMTS